ncbi:uncharacterized protein BDZ99DRAFT_473381 [Mytilinidion resinicola]|uniref:Cyclin-dependent kinase n=1 Tax=Mytilinidion resinicola TaxID=574789 RepID=A0A6A6YZV0_9PEZI|nr:uncharacterized protein BDZ99DRAFT_473381 [Mytilinidion resinicola]KAF2814290.1 hypothetical protein BDZ99DRAFT_473381 [Mytilinidion resinicola]
MASADQPAEVASKVLRRAQVSKMTRALQNRLALANVKIKHGWEDLSLDALEPRVEMELKRKRPGSSNETMSSASSTVSDRFYPHSALDSSPLAAPIFSDNVRRSGSSSSQSKRPKHGHLSKYPASSNHARVKVRTSNTTATSWKSAYRLPESSPVYHGRHAHFGRIQHAPSLSFVSETSTVPDSPSLLSEDDDEDLPITSFQVRSSLRSSPPRAPRTPPPAVARSARLRNSAFNASSRNEMKGEEDANLLMYLATSPSPAHPSTSKPRVYPPTTPPPKSTPLPSSMMSTPGGGGAPFSGFGLSTPSANLNFAEFLNMTPSPAQMAQPWNRTPAAGKTPLMAREARKRLNFDTLLPPTGNSPNVGVERTRVGKVETGLGMDLGGELCS